MKTIVILAAIAAVALTATAADSIGPTASQTVTNVTRSTIQLEVVKTQIVTRTRAPVFWHGTTQWVSSDVVLKETSVTNAVQRGGRPIRP